MLYKESKKEAHDALKVAKDLVDIIYKFIKNKILNQKLNFDKIAICTQEGSNLRQQ